MQLITVLKEDSKTQRVKAIVSMSPDSHTPARYDRADLFIEGLYISTFHDNKTIYIPDTFGKVSCQIKFYKRNDSIIKVIDSIITLNILTPFIGIKTIESGEYIQTAGSIEKPGAADDLCFIYYLRVPEGQQIIIDVNIQAIQDTRPKYNNVLSVHGRDSEYQYRYELNETPEIDIDIDLYESFPRVFNHGVYTFYIAPDCKHDLSLLTVNHSGLFNGSVQGWFKSL